MGTDTYVGQFKWGLDTFVGHFPFFPKIPVLLKFVFKSRRDYGKCLIL